MRRGIIIEALIIFFNKTPAQQKGKSGGARVIYYYHNHKIPLFLLDVYTKSEKVDLTKEELRVLRTLSEQLRKAYGD